MVEKDFAESVRELVQTMYGIVDDLDARGVGENIPFVDKKDGMRGTIRIDILLFLLRLTDKGKPISPECRNYINEYLGYDFSELTIEIARDKVAESGVPRVCIMLPCFILLDKKLGGNRLSSAYVQMMSYVALGFLQFQEHTTLEEIVRYHRYCSTCIQLIEKTLGKKVDFDPLGVINSSKRDLIKRAIEVDERFHGREEDPVNKAIEEGLCCMTQDSNKLDEEQQDGNEGTDPKSKAESERIPEKDLEESTDLAVTSPEQVSAMERLNSLVGLTEVKQKVKTLVNVLQVRKRCQQLNIKRPAIGLHMVFMGNPGTGKTTVARILGEIYKEAGFLSKGHIVEVGRVDLVGKYVGHTAAMVKEVFEQAKGGILFIDEAYSLTSEEGQGGYGKEAVETLLKLMEDNRDDIAVIAAGYPALMQEFLDSNPGFRSRFPFIVQFQDYSGAELTEIFKCYCRDNDITPSRSIMRAVRNHFESEASQRTRYYGNARAVRNYFEQMIMNQANRLAETGYYDQNDLCRFSMSDLPRKKIFTPSPGGNAIYQ